MIGRLLWDIYQDKTVFRGPDSYCRFLVACTRLYKSPCRSVGRSVRSSVFRSVGPLVVRSVGWSVRHTLLFSAKWLIETRARDLWRSALFLTFFPSLSFFFSYINLVLPNLTKSPWTQVYQGAVSRELDRTRRLQPYKFETINEKRQACIECPKKKCPLAFQQYQDDTQ